MAKRSREEPNTAKSPIEPLQKKRQTYSKGPWPMSNQEAEGLVSLLLERHPRWLTFSSAIVDTVGVSQKRQCLFIYLSKVQRE